MISASFARLPDKNRIRKPMPYVHIHDTEGAAVLATDLERSRKFALDCEAAGFHRYSDRLCLLQVSTDTRTYVVDPLAFDPSEVLRAPLEDPAVQVVMHGADFDLRLLHRDLGIRLRGLFDTQVAAALLGEPALGLQALLQEMLGISLPKKYQRADWAARPLPEDMLEYAADDTRHLMPLADALSDRLEEVKRLAWVQEECEVLEENACRSSDAPPEDPVTRVRGARDLAPREVTALREALDWRDHIARNRDRAPFRVVGDAPLVEAVLMRPLDRRQLGSIKGFPQGLARQEGDDLLDRFDRVARLPNEDLRPYPRSNRRGPARPAPETEALAERLREARNRRANSLGLDRGTLLSNAVLMAVAMENPQDEAALARVDGIRTWQVEVAGADLLEILRGRS
jgi:ribonuclease D